VLWCKVSAFGRLSNSVQDPLDAALPYAPRSYAASVACSGHELLQLAALHLSLTALAEPGAGECP
jgi:hypothetical protein